MTFLSRRKAVACAALLVSSAMLAQQTARTDISLKNWTVPSYRGLGAGGDLRAQVDISPGVAFVAMQPCRVVDTRGGGVFTGPYGPPIMAANATRNFDIDSAPHCPGIPAGVEAYSLNFTVTETTGPGDIRAWPQDNPPVQVTSVQNWQGANVTIANATIIAAGTGGGITVQVAGNNTHLLIDINGYFTDEYNTNVGFQAIGNSSTQMGLFRNLSSAANTWGVVGTIAGSSTGTLSAGVKGVSGAEPTVVSGEPSAGVLGLSTNENGVFGITTFGTGVVGHVHSPGGADLGSGRLGFNNGGTPFGVYSNGNAHVQGNLSASGTKPFVEPHRTDPSKQIEYIAVEAATADVYFRGTARIAQGVTRIAVPGDFKMVARPGSYQTQVTPVGEMATVAVIAEDENGIVVKASRNVKIHYMVYAERDAFKDHDPIIENIHFRPDADGRISDHVLKVYRDALIKNGTLNADGSINEETAKRLKWTLPGEKGSARPKH